jgi:hypothetical protein
MNKQKTKSNFHGLVDGIYQNVPFEYESIVNKKRRGASVDLLYDNTTIYICTLRSAGNGQGRQLMNRVCKDADSNNMTLKLVATSEEAMHNCRLAMQEEYGLLWSRCDIKFEKFCKMLAIKNQWLVKYYESFGFIQDGEWMVRTPQK